MRCHMVLVLLGPVLVRVEGVVSPLDKVTQELKEMKQTMTSVQASLITSVSLIQGIQTKELKSLPSPRRSQMNFLNIPRILN